MTKHAEAEATRKGSGQRVTGKEASGPGNTTSATGPVLTAKQFEALDFLLEGDVKNNGGISARQLMGLYEQRFAAECRAKGYEPWHSTNRSHGWRRAAGTVLERMRQDELLYTVHVSYGSFDYKLTDEGKAAYQQVLDRRQSA